MKIAYGTYAMPHLPLEQAIPMLHAMGYEGVEICLSPSHAGSMPQQLDAYRRTTIARLLLDHGMGVPALFILRSLLHDDGPRTSFAPLATGGRDPKSIRTSNVRKWRPPSHVEAGLRTHGAHWRIEIRREVRGTGGHGRGWLACGRNSR